MSPRTAPPGSTCAQGQPFRDDLRGLAKRFGLGLGADLRIVGPSWDNGANTNRLEGYELFDLRASFGIGDNSNRLAG